VDGKRICATCKCDKPLEDFGRPTDSWCRECANAYQLAYKNARYVPKPKQPATCGHCGAEFMADKRRSIFCSRECFEVGKHRRNIKHVQARRARERAATVEPFFPSEVYARDDWTCGLCGGAIDSAAKKPHPQSPSIDHIVPLVLGGDHSLANVQAAHLGCNVRKGARLIEGVS
jgi:5-methylcytosine-specific restriction endonuclease McrA